MIKRNTSFMVLILSLIFTISCNQSTSSSRPAVNIDECDKYSVKTTDPQVIRLRDKMIAFRQSLSQELREQATSCLQDERFYLWHNTPANNRGKRDGISYADLSPDQLTQFKSLIQMFLSTDGYQKVKEITELSEGWLNHIKPKVWNPSFYSIDMFGDPEKTGAWGVQLDGHHCVVNFLVQGNHVSIVPAFLGGEPAKGSFNGQSFDIFKAERDLALNLYNSMTEAELSKAVSNSNSRSLQVGAAGRPGKPDPYINDYDYSQFKNGLKYDDMSELSKQNITVLMKEFVYNLNEEFADIWWSDISSNIGETYFVWIDNVDSPSISSQFYYRIYNPYLWAEFNTEDVTGANSNNIEDWNHIHTITRIPNNPKTKHGGDYGVFALLINQNGPATILEHYAHAEHHHDSKIELDYFLE